MGRACSSKLKVPVNPYIILFLGALPDMDLLLDSLGITHRGITHSVFLWTLLFVPVFFLYRKRAIPYFVAVMQHMLFGDLIVGYGNPFLPLEVNASLGLDLFSIHNIALEAAGLAVFLFYVGKNGDSKIFLSKRRENLLVLLPLVPLIGFLVYIYHGIPSSLDNYIEPNQLDKIMRWGMKNSIFPFVAAMHLILVGFLSIPLVQGARALVKKQVTP
jgi:membrane-bound metal-dependent hydrolase YbcI (DUF457 family)